MVHARSEWTTRTPAWTPARRGVPDVFVHHEGGAARGVPADKAAVLREIEAGVLPKGYIAIDYNLMVFNDGDIWEGRGLAHEDGATIHNNPTSVSICAVGNYEREPAPDALVAGIARAVQYASDTGWTVPRPNIRPHRDVFATACPGANLYARMNDIRAAAAGVPTVEDDDMFDGTDRDKLNWVTNWLKRGGYNARADGKPSRIELLEQRTANIEKKIDQILAKLN